MHAVSLPVLTLIIVVMVYCCVLAGYHIARYTKRKGLADKITPPSSAVGAMTAMLAFLLALAFSMGSTRFNERKNLMLEEMNAIGTLHLRAELMSDDRAALVKRLLHEYVGLRVQVHEDFSKLELALQRSTEIQQELWTVVTDFQKEDPGNIALIPLIRATNEMIDIYGERVFIGTQHIPLVIWGSLVAITIMCMMAMGYQIGLAGKMSTIVNVILAITFSGVLYLIADLDRNAEGFFILPSQPMTELYESLG